MLTDGAYALTRRRGRTGIVTRLTSSTSDPETGDVTDVTVSYTIRRTVKQPTAYHRIYRAQATQQDIGETTFIFWLGDVKDKFTELNQEDYITFDGTRYDVVSSVPEETAVVITARRTVA